MGLPSHAQQQLAASKFNQEFLGIGGNESHADLSLFAFGNRVLPGKYMVDVELNQRSVGKTEIVFASREGAAEAMPCLQRRMLDEWGVNVAVFPALSNAADDACVDLAAIIPESSFSYDGGKQRLSISIPQAALKRSARGWVDPAKWDKGITAGLLNYQLNAGHSSGNRYANGSDLLRRDTLFGSLQGGFNYGDWRLRHFSTYNRGLDGQSRWQNVSTYLKRDLPSINGQLTIGDGNTPGNYFDSMPFRGVQLGSDEAMLPDSQQGYAPTIRGLALTNARVTVRQNGYVIYSTFVAPGAFVIDDLYPSSSSGDLEVIIEEADGRQTKYIQPFSAVPTMLREGTWRYSGTVGRYRNPGLGGYTIDGQLSLIQPSFVQATLARGLGNEVSLYGGFMAANMYTSLLAGVGKNLLDFGAVSADLSSARTIDRRPFTEDRTYDGQSLRFLYSKAFLTSGTNFRVAGYRYSTSGYRTFQEAVQVQNTASSDPAQTRRNELRFELSQQIGTLGSVYASARQQTYWGTVAKDRLVQIGYSGSYRQFGFNVYYNYSTNPISAPKRQVMFTVNIPLGDMRANAQYSLAKDESGRIGHQATVSGSAFDDRRLTYSVTAIGREGKGEGSVAADYLSSTGHWSASRSQGGQYGQSTLGVAGGMLFHESGVTLSQTLGETVALVRVPGARDVGFENQVGLATDGAGNTVVPSISPYRLNRLAVRTRDLGDTVDVKNAAVDVVPTRGAVVQADFETTVGHRLLMTLTDARGKSLPLGSKVENESGQEVGIVGPEGQAFVTGAADAGRLTVRWGRDSGQRCVVSYRLPDEKSPPPIRELNGSCETSVSTPAPALAQPSEASSKEAQ